MSFADDVMRFHEKTVVPRLGAVMLGSIRDAHASIALGSPLTGAPGQPVNTGVLLHSWQVGEKDAMTWEKGGVGTKESPLGFAGMDPGLASAIAAGKVAAVQIASNNEAAPIVEARHASMAKSVASTVANWDRIVAKNLDDVVGGAP